MLNVLFYDLTGFQPYEPVWQFQQHLHNQVLHNKHAGYAQGFLILCEHEHVYTLGKFGKHQNLLINEQMLNNINARFYHIDRGGDITYHGPGQLVGYPILPLSLMNIGVKTYIHLLEQSIIDTLTHFGIQSERNHDAIGVWLDPSEPARARKICAIGVRVSGSVTMHGFALNVNTDLTYFNYINPCGIIDKGVTSMQKELNRPVDMKAVKEKFIENFASVFKVSILKAGESIQNQQGTISTR